MMVGTAKKGPSKENQKEQKPKSKEATSRKRCKNVAANESPTKISSFWSDEVKTPTLAEVPDVVDKVKKNIKNNKKNMEPNTSESVRYIHMNRFVTGKR